MLFRSMINYVKDKVVSFVNPFIETLNSLTVRFISSLANYQSNSFDDFTLSIMESAGSHLFSIISIMEEYRDEIEWGSKALDTISGIINPAGLALNIAGESLMSSETVSDLIDLNLVSV